MTGRDYYLSNKDFIAHQEETLGLLLALRVPGAHHRRRLTRKLLWWRKFIVFLEEECDRWRREYADGGGWEIVPLEENAIYIHQMRQLRWAKGFTGNIQKKMEGWYGRF